MSDTPKLKVAFLTASNPRDRGSQSGSYYYMSDALLRNGAFDVSFITLMNQSQQSIRSSAYKVAEASPFKKKLRFLFTFYNALRNARIAKRKLNGLEFDFILAPAAAREIAFFNTKIPLVYINDCTWGLLINYLRNYTGLAGIAVWQGNIVEKKAIDKCVLNIFSSQWAANSAIEKYGAAPSKVAVIQWGANMENVPEREIALARKLSSECRLLLVGRGWERKGAQIAFDTLLELEKLGINAHLTICGMRAPENISHPRLTVIPNLDKKDEQQRKQLADLFLTSDFFILPTRAECSSMVLNESAAFGLPVVVTNTGGLGSTVEDGITGCLVPYNGGGAEYARAIKKLYADEAGYMNMVRASRKRFEDVLNWDVWANKLAEKLKAYKNTHN